MVVADLTELADRITATSAHLDAAALSATEAEALVAVSARVANAAEHLAAVGARRVGQTGAHRRCGDRTEAHHLARVSGRGVGAARQSLATLDRLDTLASTRAAAGRGELSARQATAISEAALLDRAAEGRLLRMAKSRSLGDLEEECARVRAAAAPDDEEERHRRARRDRGCWQRRGRDGSAEILYRSSPDEIAEAWSVIDAFRAHRFRNLTDDAPREGFDAHVADGFLDMARAAAAGCRTDAAGRGDPVDTPAVGHEDAAPTLPLKGVPAPRPAPVPSKIIVRIDWDALVRGYPVGGECSEIAGVGPVAVPVVHDMIRTGDPFLAAVVTKGVDVVSVAHLGRRATAHQLTGLQWLRPRCRAEGCDRTVGLEIDHTVPWATSKFTLLGLLDWLCTHHHRLKSHQGWGLVGGRGIRPFVPPDDPRHPDRAGPPRQPS